MLYHQEVDIIELSVSDEMWIVKCVEPSAHHPGESFGVWEARGWNAGLGAFVDFFGAHLWPVRRLSMYPRSPEGLSPPCHCTDTLTNINILPRCLWQGSGQGARDNVFERCLLSPLDNSGAFVLPVVGQQITGYPSRCAR